MLLFSAKARQLLDNAVNALPDVSRRAVWRTWASEHPYFRQPDGPADDGGPPLPGDVADVALYALQEMADSKTNRRTASNISEDEAADLENDLTYIRAVVRQIKETSSS
jgi:hypothetical protein